MKNTFTTTLLTLILIFGCSSSDDSNESLNNDCRLTGFNSALLYFSEEESNHNPTQIFGGNTNKVYIEYDDSNNISRVIGGLISSPDGALLVDYVENNITFVGNKIFAENRRYSFTEPFIIGFEIDNNILISREVTGFSPFLGDKVYIYEYVDDSILEYQEYDNNNILTRKFYLSYGNLTRVDIFQYDFNVNLVGKKEVLFEDYDDLENLLRGYYYIPFAFYNSFSNNNFQTVRLNYYTYENNEFVFEGEIFSRTFNFQSSSIQQEGLFEESCN